LNINFHSIDISADAIKVSKIVTGRFRNRIQYHNVSSEVFLTAYNEKIDLLYMDAAEADEEGANLHLKDAKTIVGRNLMSDNGIILIDDVNLPSNLVSKGKYSIPFLLQNGYCQVLPNNYQAVLQKNLLQKY
jgi:hypothetical protein